MEDRGSDVANISQEMLRHKLKTDQNEEINIIFVSLSASTSLTDLRCKSTTPRGTTIKAR